MGKIFDAIQKSTKTPDNSEMPGKPVEEGGHKESNITSIDTRQQRAPQEKVVKREKKPAGKKNIDRVGHKNEPLTHNSAIKESPKNPSDKYLIAAHRPHSFEAEQFRMLRTNLLFPKSGQVSPRILLVTSALPGEGKSFVSANLAVTIAQNVDKHVLLIDADMRRPTAHTLFGFGNVNGLSNYLNDGQQSLPELLLPTPHPRLTILPGGPVPSNPAELISSGRMAALLREVKSRYDDRYIIVDSPPPHLTSESNALAQFVDGIILVVKLGGTPRKLITQLINQFDDKNIVGIVANWVEETTHSFYGSDTYSKHHYFGKKGKG